MPLLLVFSMPLLHWFSSLSLRLDFIFLFRINCFDSIFKLKIKMEFIGIGVEVWMRLEVCHTGMGSE